MKMTRRFTIILILILLLAGSQQANAQQPVVEAVMFFSPTCNHCEKVIQNDLPPLKSKYGNQFRLYMVDVSINEGANLYQATMNTLNTPDDRIGVPALIVGDTLLVGDIEIPDQLPGLIDTGLQSGGQPLPKIEPLANLSSSGLASLFTVPGASGEPTGADLQEGPLWLTRFNRDRVANTLAVVVLLGMLVSLGWALVALLRVAPDEKTHQNPNASRRNKKAKTPPISKNSFTWPAWLIPALALTGLGVAAYLSYVEITKDTAVCGPVGDCNAVQQSPYARLFGWLPVGILGALGYIGIMLAWLLYRYGPPAWRNLAAIAIWVMAFFGVLFSVYLTFLEPFVIGATCMWCITSAIVITLILIASTAPAREFLQAESD